MARRELFNSHVVIEGSVRLVDRVELSGGEAGCEVIFKRDTSGLRILGWTDQLQRVRITVIIEEDDRKLHSHSTIWDGGINKDKHEIEISESKFRIAYWKEGPNGARVAQWPSCKVSVDVEPLGAQVATGALIRAV